MKIKSLGSNDSSFVGGTKVSDKPSFLAGSIICPCASIFLYPGNGTNIGVKFCLSLIA